VDIAAAPRFALNVSASSWNAVEKRAWISDLTVRLDLPLNRYVFQTAFSFGSPNATVFSLSLRGFWLVLSNKSSPVLFLVWIFRSNRAASVRDPSIPLQFIDAFLPICCVWLVGPMCGDDINQGPP
jgi:hypothetical protein